MPSNIEIKARLRDFTSACKQVERLSDTPAEVIRQRDIFFHVPHGRLKLRILTDDQGELIYYHRENVAGPKESQYEVAPVSSPERLRQILNLSLQSLGEVRKTRRLFRVGQTRIHLDQVESLGDFLELEVVLHEAEPKQKGVRVAEELMGRLQIRDEDLIDCAYIDLLVRQASKQFS